MAKRLNTKDKNGTRLKVGDKVKFQFGTGTITGFKKMVSATYTVAEIQTDPKGNSKGGEKILSPKIIEKTGGSKP